MKEQKIIELEDYSDYDTDEFFEELETEYGKNAKFVLKYIQNFDDLIEDNIYDLIQQGIIEEDENAMTICTETNYNKLLESWSSEFTNVTFTNLGNDNYKILSKPLSLKELRQFFENYFMIEDEIAGAFCSDTMTHTIVEEATLTVEYEE